MVKKKKAKKLVAEKVEVKTEDSGEWERQNDDKVEVKMAVPEKKETVIVASLGERRQAECVAIKCPYDNLYNHSMANCEKYESKKDCAYLNKHIK